MIAVKPTRGGYLVRVKTRQGYRLLGPYATEAEAAAVRADYRRQQLLGREA